MALILLGLGPVAGWVAYRSAEEAHSRQVQGAFDVELARRSRAIAEQVLSYEEVLHACQGLYDASERVTNDEFSTFTRRARNRHPCIDAVAWAPLSEDHGRLAYRLAFIEPRSRHAHLVSMDLHGSDLSRSALERALRTGEPSLSAPITGDLSGLSTSAFGLMVLGVYTVAKDGDHGEPMGAVLLSFRFDDLVTAGHGRDTGESPLMRLALFDVTAEDPSKLAAIHGKPTDVAADISAQKDLTLAGRTWRLSALPTREFLARHESNESLGIAGLVFLLWELLAGLMLALSHASRSHAVRRQGRNMARVLQSLGEGVLVAGEDGHVRLPNEAARALIGGVLDDADAATFGRAVRFVRADDKTAFGPQDSPLERAMRGEIFDEEQCLVYTPNRPEGVYLSVSGRPLRDEWGRLLGGVLAFRDDTERRRNEMELRQKDAALRARSMEMELAAKVQKRFYPATPPQVRGLDLAGAVRPADETCGDYYDFLELPDGSLLLAVGDVSGHGLGPALVMAETRAYVRSLARAGCSPSKILERCNDQLCKDLADDLFVTMLLIRIDKDGSKLAFASAGHTPALIVDAEGVLRKQLERCGPPLGIVEDRKYPLRGGIDFDASDVLVLMTDGVTEATSPAEEHFEEEGVLEVVRKHRHREAGEILREIGQALDRFAGERIRRDDVTLVVAKRTVKVPSRRGRSLSTTWSD